MAKLNPKGTATKATINMLCDSIVERAHAWFDEHPNEPYCYWAQDEFISIADKDKPEVLDRHPEIENRDFTKHTIVQYEKTTGLVKLSNFCDRLKEGTANMYECGVVAGKGSLAQWALFKDYGINNYELIMFV